MTKLVKNRDGNFTHVKNDILESGLHAKSIGLFMYLWHLPDDWEFYEDEITKHFMDGKDSIRTGLKELERAGFLKRIQKHDENTGQFGKYIWVLNESPILENPKSDKPKLENPNWENPNWENPPLQNTNSTKYSDIQNTDSTNLSRGEATQEKKPREKAKLSKFELAKKRWKKQLDPQLVNYASELATETAEHETAYLNSTLKDWQSKGLQTLNDVKNYVNNKSSRSFKNEPVKLPDPDWMNDNYKPEVPKVTEADRQEVREMLKQFKHEEDKNL